MNKKQTDQADRNFIAQAHIEIEKARGCFEDIDYYIRRSLAIQWMLERNGDEFEIGLRDAIQEMIDELLYYQSKLINKSGQEYKDLIQEMFFDQVETDFCKEAILGKDADQIDVK